MEVLRSPTDTYCKLCTQCTLSTYHKSPTTETMLNTCINKTCIPKLDGIKVMWNGGEDSGAVSSVIVTGTGATMVHRNSKTLGIAYYLMGTTTVYGNYKTDTTSLLFKLRVVQALFWRTLPRFSHLTTGTKTRLVNFLKFDEFQLQI